MTNIIVMSKKEVNRLPVLTKLQDKKINNNTAAKMLGITIRQIKRIKKKFKKQGAEGLIHKSRGKRGHNRLPNKIITRATNLLRAYLDREIFGILRAYEKQTNSTK